MCHPINLSGKIGSLRAYCHVKTVPRKSGTRIYQTFKTKKRL